MFFVGIYEDLNEFLDKKYFVLKKSGSGFSKSVDPDPDSENPDPKHCF
jgi:hypothetical protein